MTLGEDHMKTRAGDMESWKIAWLGDREKEKIKVKTLGNNPLW